MPLIRSQPESTIIRIDNSGIMCSRTMIIDFNFRKTLSRKILDKVFLVRYTMTCV